MLPAPSLMQDAEQDIITHFVTIYSKICLYRRQNSIQLQGTHGWSASALSSAENCLMISGVDKFYVAGTATDSEPVAKTHPTFILVQFATIGMPLMPYLP